MIRIPPFTALVLLQCMVLPVRAQLDTLDVASDRFDRDMRVYRYDNSPQLADKPIIYFTDGQKMIDNGLLQELESLSEKDALRPAYFVFVSTIDPATGIDHRNDYFFCNPNFLALFEETVIPRVEQDLNQSFDPQHRALIGISFGGLNAAYFATKSESFGSYALLSPITYPCLELHADIALSEIESRRVFISTGTLDAERYAKPLLALFESKSYQTEFLQTAGGHDFQNWNGQLQEVLAFLYPPE